MKKDIRVLSKDCPLELRRLADAIGKDFIRLFLAILLLGAGQVVMLIKGTGTLFMYFLTFMMFAAVGYCFGLRTYQMRSLGLNRWLVHPDSESEDLEKGNGDQA